MISECLRGYRYRLGIINSVSKHRLQTCNSSFLPEPHPNPRNRFGMSVTWSVINYGKSVTMSVNGGGLGLADTYFNFSGINYGYRRRYRYQVEFLELDMK